MRLWIVLCMTVGTMAGWAAARASADDVPPVVVESSVAPSRAATLRNLNSMVAKSRQTQPKLEPLPPPQVQHPANQNPALQPKAPSATDKSRPVLPEDRSLKTVTATIRPTGKVPGDAAAERFAATAESDAPRPWLGQIYAWEAPALCHHALCFEQPCVERNGYSVSHVLQPAISGAHFFGSALLLPYSLTCHPPHECRYVLGHDRPGSPMPYRLHLPEMRPEAGLAEAGVVMGLIFLIP